MHKNSFDWALQLLTNETIQTMASLKTHMPHSAEGNVREDSTPAWEGSWEEHRTGQLQEVGTRLLWEGKHKQNQKEITQQVGSTGMASKLCVFLREDEKQQASALLGIRSPGDILLGKVDILTGKKNMLSFLKEHFWIHCSSLLAHLWMHIFTATTEADPAQLHPSIQRLCKKPQVSSTLARALVETAGPTHSRNITCRRNLTFMEHKPPKIQSFCWWGAPLLSYSIQFCVIVLQHDTGVRIINVLAGDAGINRAPMPVEWAVLQIHLLQTEASSSNDQIFKTEFTASAVYCIKEPIPHLWVSYVLWFIPRWPFCYNCSGNFGKHKIFKSSNNCKKTVAWSWVARFDL